MKKTMTLAEAKTFYENDRVFETETSFMVNQFGKYQPNITFLVPKEVNLGKNGKPMSPLTYVADKEITDNMNIDFDGSAAFMFGDFWVSKKGGACFRPKSPTKAKHLLIRVDWGGAFNDHRGVYPGDAKKIGELLYFRRASSNGGGSGYDYWVLPVGFCATRDEDSEIAQSNNSELFARRAKEWAEKHAKIQREKIAEADTHLREKAAAEEASRNARDEFVPKLEGIKLQLEDLKVQEYGQYSISDLKIGETYFKLGILEYLYTSENVEKAERELERLTEWVAESEAKHKLLFEAREKFTPRFENLRAEAESYGWQLTIQQEKAHIKNHKNACWTFDFSEEGVTEFIKQLTEHSEFLRAKDRERQKLEAEAQAKAQGLPSDIRVWHRSGRTNAGKAWVITPQGMDRECDSVDTSVCSSNSKKYHQSYEGDHVWNQVMPGELVLGWKKAYTAAPHEFFVIYQPETLTEAQLERVAEIQAEISEAWDGLTGLASGDPCPSIGDGWGLLAS